MTDYDKRYEDERRYREYAHLRYLSEARQGWEESPMRQKDWIVLYGAFTIIGILGAFLYIIF